MSGERGFLRSIVTLLTGATLAQLLPLLAAPLLTRLYGPEDFGLFAFYSGLMSNLAVVATGRYELAIVLPAEEDDAVHLLALSLLVAAAWTIALLIVGLLFGAPLAVWLGHPEIGPWLPLLAVTVGLAGTTQALTNWANRRRRDRLMSTSRFAQSGGMVTAQLSGGAMGAGEEGLILGQLTGQGIATLVLGWNLLITRFRLFRQVSWQKMVGLARQYHQFPAVNAVHAFVYAFQETGALWLLAHYGGPAALGFYGLTMRVLKTPVGLVGGVLGQVFYQRMAEVRNRGESLGPMLKRMAILLGTVALIPTLVLGLGGEWLFAHIFGPQWAEAGRYAQWLSPFVLLYFVASPLAMAPLVLGRQRAAFIFAVVGIVLYLGGLAMGLLWWHRVDYGLGLISIAMAIYYIMFFGWLARAVRQEAVHADR